MSGHSSSEELGQRIREEGRKRCEELQKIVDGFKGLAGDQRLHHDRYSGKLRDIENTLRSQNQDHGAELGILLQGLRETRAACRNASLNFAQRLEVAEKKIVAETVLPNGSSPQETVQIGRCIVTITAEAGINLKQVLDAKLFQEWIDTIAEERRIQVSKVHIQSLDMVNTKVSLLKFKAEADMDGQPAPAITVFSGGAVATLVVLHQADHRFTMVVRQPRPAVCLCNVPELPAGRLDGELNFAAVAAKELRDQIGFQVQHTDLIDMTHLAYKDRYPGVFPSCGELGEFKRLFLYHKRVTAGELADLNGQLSLISGGGATIRPQVMLLESLWRTSPDASTLAALCLYEKLSVAGLIPKVAAAWEPSQNLGVHGSPLVERLETLRATISRLSPGSLRHLEHARNLVTPQTTTRQGPIA